MTEKQQEIVTQLLSYLEQAAKTAGNLAQTELPPLLREIIALGVFEGVMMCGAAIGLGVGFRKVLRAYRALGDSRWDDEDKRIGLGLLGAACVLFWIWVGVGGIYRLGMIYFAPRYYLLSELKEFLR